jgi:phosphoesterase RecJ-like protein
MKYPEAKQIVEILAQAKTVVIMQADNPDGDSLSSSLALEEILGELGIEPVMYCGVDVPSYLRYLSGWDRVTNELPKNFDASIIVDMSADGLFDTLERSGQKPLIASKPCIVIDHHQTDQTISFATVNCNKPAVATGEVIYELAEQLEWKLNDTAKEMIAVSIMSDSLGLVSEGTTPRSIHIIAELVEEGVVLARLENDRRAMMRKSPELLNYKGKLLQRIAYAADNRIATIDIPWDEIQKYSPLYNPSMLVIDDMRMGTDTQVAIAFKVYKNDKVTAKIRCNYGYAIGAELAEHFGGGGHPYASGFKVEDGRSFADVKAECIQKATVLLNQLKETKHEAA